MTNHIHFIMNASSIGRSSNVGRRIRGMSDLKISRLHPVEGLPDWWAYAIVFLFPGVVQNGVVHNMLYCIVTLAFAH